VIVAFNQLRCLTCKHVLVHSIRVAGTDEAVLWFTRHITFGWLQTSQMERKTAQTPSSDLENANDLQTESNTSALFAPTSAENMPVKEDRVFKKAKRSLKVNTKSEDGSMTSRNGLLPSGSPTSPTGARSKGGPPPFSKNSRKSRNVMSHGRGQPKKGGTFVILCLDEHHNVAVQIYCHVYRCIL